ncbi:MAG: GntR family transcriptional regulator [Pseudomonadota bacterium]
MGRVKASVPRLRTVQPETMQDRVYATLRDAIMSGQFVPGQVISIRSLADELGTSAMPVRDALGRLVTEGAVDASNARALKIVQLSPVKLMELTKIRVNLESLATEIAAQKITKAELARLDRISSAFKQAALEDNLPVYLAANRDFHFCIYRAAQMPTLMNIIEGLWLQIGPTLNALLSTQSIIDYDTAVHDEAVRALKDGDANRARDAIVRDLEAAAQQMMATDYFAQSAAG